MADMAFVSPPQDGGGSEYKCYVESNKQLYETFWKGSQHFPDLRGVHLRRVNLSDEVSTTWLSSNRLGFGSSAVVRTLDEDRFPIVKIAHPNTDARQQIQHEYEIMRSLSHFDGAADVDSEPLKDKDGIFGFRLERLSKIDFADLQMRSSEVRRLVKALHDIGYSHGDLSPSNVMVKGNGRLVLIDFSFSGPVGQRLATHIPRWVYDGAAYETTADFRRLDRYFQMTQEM